ncbi:hypothetical protein [Piscinibacter koreensis]|uniref:Uncharacterized protein n=1 Tax=Piscinibacter koreensis TaxID=2742824 RepID=A0A7Y6NMK0_9BURK|nr:hypothetical protein [Schlegelella koreensis]NUZ05834.1 hypothetical protein [Schlegelella koreensis]
MQVLIRLLRRRGVPIAPPVLEATLWTEGTLCTSRQHGARCLGIKALSAHPDAAPMALLFAPAVVRVDGETLVLRGIERVEDASGVVAGVVQEWAVRSRPSLGPLGRLSPQAHAVRPDLPA